MRTIVVIGIGQTLRGDDAAGVEAVHLWQSAFPATAGRPEVRVEFSELPGLGLLDLLDGFDAALLVDAVQGSGPAGTVYHLGPEDLASFAAGSKSAHGWGVAESLELGRRLNPSLQQIRIRLIGIEVESMELGRALSPAVREALAPASSAIEEEVQALLGG